MAASKKSPDKKPVLEKLKKPLGPNWNSRLAKAEAVLALALFSEVVLNPWLFQQAGLSPLVKTLIKMLLVVGCFGPVFNLISWVVDSGLQTARTSVGWFSAPKVLAHLLLLCGFFAGFYWVVNKSTPWRDYPQAFHLRSNSASGNMAKTE